MNDATATQLRLIAEIRDALAAAGIPWWLFGGWGVDFLAGEVTRDHTDIEFFVWQRDVAAVRSALQRAGFVWFPSLHPDEGDPYVRKGQEAGATFLVPDEDGRAHTPGRWADWSWLAGSFESPPGRIGDLEVPVMSAAGLLDVKQNFHAHSHGAPLREKDVADIALLRALIDAGRP